jgi:hypothetical protein
VLAYVNRKTFQTPTEKAAVQEKRNSLRRQLDKWREIQVVYMPGAVAFRGATFDADAGEMPYDNHPELVRLWLPSQIPASHRAPACLAGIVSKEQRLRIAQVHDALLELRHSRRVYRGVLNHYKIHVAGTGQRMATKSQAIIINSANRIKRACTRYRACRAALLALDPNGSWTQKYLELKPEDNRGPGKEEHERGLGDGSYTQLWIWQVSPNVPGHASRSSGSENPEELSIEEFHVAMRVEWAQIQARAERWEEEYELIRMEMVRTWLFLEHKALEWDQRKDIEQEVPIDLARGLTAYAVKQAAVYRSLARNFLSDWLSTVNELKLSCAWFYDDTMFILRQIGRDPTKFLLEWDLISAELGLPPTAALHAQSSDRLSPVTGPVTAPAPAASSTSASIPNPTPQRPLPRSSTRAPSSHPLAGIVPQHARSESQGGGFPQDLRPRQALHRGTNYDESDGESQSSEDAGDDYIDEEEKEDYNSDDLDIDLDD